MARVEDIEALKHEASRVKRVLPRRRADEQVLAVSATVFFMCSRSNAMRRSCDFPQAMSIHAGTWEAPLVKFRVHRTHQANRTPSPQATPPTPIHARRLQTIPSHHREHQQSVSSGLDVIQLEPNRRTPAILLPAPAIGTAPRIVAERRAVQRGQHAA